MIKKCLYCKKEFFNHSIYANHVRWCKLNPNYQKINNNENIRNGVVKRYNSKLGYIKEFLVQCFICKKMFIVKERENQFPKKEKYFCSRNCSNSGLIRTKERKSTTTESFKDKMSRISKDLWKNPSFIKKCLDSSKSIIVSQGEYTIRKYFQWNFPYDFWTYGGNLVYNKIPLVRDLYSNKLKVCIEYDGIWHFEDIVGQLKYKQKQDLSLENWCIDNHFKLIRIKEDIFLKDENYWIQKIVKEVYNGKQNIVKFY